MPQVSEMTKDTQDTMAQAQAQSDAADAQAAELARVSFADTLRCFGAFCCLWGVRVLVL